RRDLLEAVVHDLPRVADDPGRVWLYPRVLALRLRRPGVEDVRDRQVDGGCRRHGPVGAPPPFAGDRVTGWDSSDDGRVGDPALLRVGAEEQVPGKACDAPHAVDGHRARAVRLLVFAAEPELEPTTSDEVRRRTRGVRVGRQLRFAVPFLRL